MAAAVAVAAVAVAAVEQTRTNTFRSKPICFLPPNGYC